MRAEAARLAVVRGAARMIAVAGREPKWTRSDPVGHSLGPGAIASMAKPSSRGLADRL